MPAPSLLAHLDASKDSTALSLAYASVGDDGCTAIARYMRENVMLRTLDLRGNNIRADGLVVLAHGLRTGGGNMTSVCFKWNQIGSHPRGIQAFCDVLKENQSITHVDLRNNKIGTDCGPFLGDMLRENCTLTHLDLSWNDLGVEGGKALLDGLQANHSLIDCQLSGNRLAEDTLHAIAFILRRNRQTAPMGASTFRQERAMSPSQDPGSPMGSPMSPMSAQAPTTPASPGFGSTTPASPGFGTTGRSLNMTIASEGGMGPTSPKEGPPTTSLPPLTPAKVQPPVHDEEPAAAAINRLTLKLLQREQNHSNVEDARFFGEVAEYIDLLQLDVARNKKYRMDAEERERVVTKGFMEREMRYAQEMRELENLLARAKAEKGTFTVGSAPSFFQSLGPTAGGQLPQSSANLQLRSARAWFGFPPKLSTTRYTGIHCHPGRPWGYPNPTKRQGKVRRLPNVQLKRCDFRISTSNDGQFYLRPPFPPRINRTLDVEAPGKAKKNPWPTTVHKDYKLKWKNIEYVYVPQLMRKPFGGPHQRWAGPVTRVEHLQNGKTKSELVTHDDEILHDADYVQHEIDKVRAEKSKTVDDRNKMEEIAQATADRLRADIRDALTMKADLETQIYKTKRRQQEQEEENARLRRMYSFVSQLAYFFAQASLASQHKQYPLNLQLSRAGHGRLPPGAMAALRLCSMWLPLLVLPPCSLSREGAAAQRQDHSEALDRFCGLWGPCGAQPTNGCSFEAQANGSAGDMTATCLKDAYGCLIRGGVEELAEGCLPGVLGVLLAGLDSRLRRCDPPLECVIEVEHSYSRLQSLWPRAGVPYQWAKRWSLPSWRRQVDAMFDREDGLRALRGVCLKWMSSAAVNRLKLPWIGEAKIQERAHKEWLPNWIGAAQQSQVPDWVICAMASTSQLAQDLWVLSRLGHVSNGLFLEIGANHPSTMSNTLLLEAAGWNGVCVEPFPRGDWSKRRAQLVIAAVGQVEGGRATFALPGSVWGGLLSSMDPSNVQRLDRDYPKEHVQVAEVDTRSIEAILREALPSDQPDRKKVIHFMSVDTEGSELEILQAFPFDRYLPVAIAVEHLLLYHPPSGGNQP
eukprot:s921_g12.t6